MPELPEVRVVSNKLNKILKNKEIIDVTIKLPKMIKNVNMEYFRNSVIKQKIISVKNKGKWILIKLSNKKTIVVHLRLEGKFKTKTIEKEMKHNHIIFMFHNNLTLYFNDTRQFGTFHLFDNDKLLISKPLITLANEPQETDIEWLYSKLQKKRIAIKTSLLDQTLVVGLGNIYVNEVLWEEKIFPERPSNKVSKKELISILKTSYEIMEKSYKLGGSTIDSYESLNKQEGTYQIFLKVHMKKGEKCKRCFGIIVKKSVGGRGTYYCPICQKI